MDPVSLASEVFPSVMAAVKKLGAAVLSKGEEAAADASVGFGRRVLQRVFGQRAAEETAPLELVDLASVPDDADLQTVLRVKIRKALEADPHLAADVAAMLKEAAGASGAVTAGDHSPVVSNSRIGGDNIQIGEIGGDASIGRK